MFSSVIQAFIDMLDLVARHHRDDQTKGSPFVVLYIPFVCHTMPKELPFVCRNVPSVKIRHFLGFTAIELLITIVIAAILLGLALPDLRVFVQNNRLKTEASEFVAALNYARTEAKANALTVTVCVSTNGAACTGAAWKLGWLVWGDADGDTAIDAVEVIRARAAPDNGIVLASSADPAETSIAFFADGSTTTDLMFTVCDDTRAGEEGREITITPIGLVRSKKINCA